MSTRCPAQVKRTVVTRAEPSPKRFALAAVAELRRRSGLCRFERTDHVSLCSPRFIVPVRERVVVDQSGELVQRAGEIVDGKVATAVGLFFQDRDKRAEERPGD